MRQHCPDPAYANETWRAKHHFKELHQHNPPARRNKDFKATPYGAVIGITNFRHATPFLLLKHLGDFRHEEKHHPTKWVKRFIAGAMFGLVVGQGLQQPQTRVARTHLEDAPRLDEPAEAWRLGIEVRHGG